MGMLTQEDVEKQGKKPKTVTIEDWGGDIKIRKMSVAESEAWQGQGDDEELPSFDAERPLLSISKIVQRCTVEPVFTSVEQVMNMSVGGVDEAFDAIAKYSGLLNDKAIEEAEGNSDAIHPVDSPAA